MGKQQGKHSSIDRNREIDQRATKIFSCWLPDDWLSRKQDPDVFIDYVVEVPADGEPSGKHFAAQIKGYEDQNGSKPLKYSFETKHLKYYLNKCQHPVFLFLINVTTREGFWIFAQKFLTEKAKKKLAAKQQSLTIHFLREDNLTNITKFKCLLPEAERFVHDLHPGSPLAAIQKRQADLEKIDPRCAVQVSVCNGREQVAIQPKEPFSFSMSVNSKNVEGWKAFVEKGEMIRTTPGEVSFAGMPLFQDVLNRSAEIQLQIAQQRPSSINIINCNVEFPEVTHIDGTFVIGTKFSRFLGHIPNSPLRISFELPHECLDTIRSVGLVIEFSLSKWAGQPILDLAAFNQIKIFSESFSGETNPKFEISVEGNRLNRGELGGRGTPIFDFIEKSLEWLIKCRWLAEHFKVNPLLPALDVFSQADFNNIQELHDILKFGQIVYSKPYLELSIEVAPTEGRNIAPADTVKSLRLHSLNPTYNFFGTPISLPSIQHVFSEVNLFSRTSVDGSKIEKLVFKGNEKTRQFSSLVT